jgi:hypothetical protein
MGKNVQTQYRLWFFRGFCEHFKPSLYRQLLDVGIEPRPDVHRLYMAM